MQEFVNGSIHSDENDMTPQKGRFYRDTDEDETFEVISVDKENGMIEIQFTDGGIEEISIECWEEFNLVPAEKF